MHTYDFVIVGAGSAGCVLAARLSEDPSATVLLLEAGGSDRVKEVAIPAAFTQLFGTSRDWAYETVPQKELAGRRLRWPRGKMLGGSSSMNAQMYVRGQRADYDGWSESGCPGWGYDSVLPYFARAEGARTAGPDVLGRGGPVRISDLRDPNPLTAQFLAAAVEAGLSASPDINAAAAEGVAMTPVTQSRGRRHSAADAYLRPARRRPNLTVRTGAHARRVVFEGRRAVGVEVTTAGGERETVRAHEVLLAGGAVNSPQLLLLSGVGPAAELSELGLPVVQDSPGVGTNLQDHLSVAVVHLTDRPVTLVAAQSISELLRFLFRRRGMLTSNVGEALGLLSSGPEEPAPDLELVFAPVPFLDHGATTPPGHGYTVGPVLLRPRSTGRITLDSSDPSAPPRIDPADLTDPDGADLRRLVHGVRLAQRVLASKAFADCAGRPYRPDFARGSDADVEEFVRARAETLYHPVGTCRMGSSADSVVDPELRVRGVEGLRVVDASVMPAINRGHTHAPTLMIAERAADLIRRGRGALPAATLAAGAR